MEDFLALVLARLDQVPNLVDTSAIWNNQFKRLAQEQQFLYPVAFIEPTDVTYTELSAGFQEVTLTLKVHVVNESPFQGTERDIYALKEQVNRYLYHYSAEGNCTPFVRTAEELDLDHDNLYDYQLIYRTLFRVSVEPLEEQTVTLGDFTLETDLDIDNEVVRTGDGRFPEC